MPLCERLNRAFQTMKNKKESINTQNNKCMKHNPDNTNRRANANVFSTEKTGRSQTSIRREIDAIYDEMTEKASAMQIVCRERPEKGTSCAGIISVYSVDDINRQKRERAACAETVRRQGGETAVPKPFRAQPIARFAFYPGVTDPSAIGSMAVYGRTAVLQYRLLKQRGDFFGHPIASVTLERSVNLFASVKFAV